MRDILLKLGWAGSWSSFALAWRLLSRLRSPCHSAVSPSSSDYVWSSKLLLDRLFSSIHLVHIWSTGSTIPFLSGGPIHEDRTADHPRKPLQINTCPSVSLNVKSVCDSALSTVLSYLTLYSRSLSVALLSLRSFDCLTRFTPSPSNYPSNCPTTTRPYQMCYDSGNTPGVFASPYVRQTLNFGCRSVAPCTGHIRFRCPWVRASPRGLPVARNQLYRLGMAVSRCYEPFAA